jgi:putative DNA primase/helicase
MIVSNETLSLRDSSGALMSRFLTIELTRSFLGHEDRGLFGRLSTELPGILLWAIQGWKRLRNAEGFTQPDCESLREEMEEMTSPVKAFLRDRCEVGEPGDWEAAAALFSAWKMWHAENESEPGTQTAFGRALRSAVPGIRKERSHIGGEKSVVYRGVRLLKDGEERAIIPF